MVDTWSPAGGTSVGGVAHLEEVGHGRVSLGSILPCPFLYSLSLLSGDHVNCSAPTCCPCYDGLTFLQPRAKHIFPL
jgi:hypothetical protein